MKVKEEEEIKKRRKRKNLKFHFIWLPLANSSQRGKNVKNERFTYIYNLHNILK